MNDHLDLHEQRLARELRTAAQHVELTPGNELAVVTRGRRRRARHRRATGFALVATIGAGTALGVQQLARTGDSGLAIDRPVDTESDTAIDDAVTPGSVPASTPESSVPQAVPAAKAPAADGVPDDVPLAQLVESNIEWTVVEPDSAAAVAYGTVMGASGGATVPGVMLATAPGRSDDYQSMFWQTDDGITWQPLTVDAPVGNPEGMLFDGSSVYAVGTAPGIAATQPNPLLVSSSSDGGATWTQAELPIDTNAGRDLPLVRSIGIYSVPVPVAGGTVVVANRNVDLDWDELTARDSRLANGWYELRPDGVTVLTGEGCSDTRQEPGLVPFDAIVATTAPVGAGGGSGCETELITWADLDVPDETVALLNAGATRAFLLRDGEAAELVVPATTLYYNGIIDGTAYFADIDGNWFTLDAEADFVASDGPGPSVGRGLGWTIGSNGDTAYSSVQIGSGLIAFRDLVVAEPTEGSDGADAAAWSDWSLLYGDESIASRGSFAVTGAGLVSVAMVRPDPIAVDGGTAVAAGGLTITRSSSRTDPEFSFTDTGEPIPVSMIRSDSMTADVVAVDEAGAEVARMPSEVAGPVLWGADGSGVSPENRWYVETASDVGSVAVESIADLLGVDDADISSVPRISTDGTNVIVAVTMKERNEAGVPRQLVLVGTPLT